MATRLSICSRWFCITSLETEKRGIHSFTNHARLEYQNPHSLWSESSCTESAICFYTLFNYAFLFAISSTLMVLHTMHFHCMEHFVQASKMLCSTEHTTYNTENHTGWMKQTCSVFVAISFHDMQLKILMSQMQKSSHSKKTNRMIPKSSKYPPRPWVPNGSLKVRTTHATLSRFHMGPNIRFPNL